MKIAERNYKPDVEVLERIVEKLNKKFDPYDSYGVLVSPNRKMFEGVYAVAGSEMEAWSITCCKVSIFSGGKKPAYKSCQEEGYITLEAKNERAVYLLAESAAINHIKSMMKIVSLMNVSNKNKLEWIDILKSNLEEDNHVKLSEMLKSDARKKTNFI